MMMNINTKRRTLFKNGFLFKECFFTDNEFAASFKLMIDKWNPSYKNQERIVFCWEYRDYKEVRKRNKIAYDRRVKFINSLVDGKVSEFRNDILAFLGKFNFGKEWLNTIADFILSMWLYPPMFNLHTDENNGAKGKKRVLLELNPDTSIDDIKEAWREISQQQKELYPSFKKRYVTSKSFENLNIAIKDKKDRVIGTRKVFDPALVQWQEYKTKDTDIAGGIWSDEEDISENADRRRAANLRKIRQRFKEKTA